MNYVFTRNKRQSIDNFEILSLLENKKVKWVIKSSQGLLRGMITIWNVDLFKVEDNLIENILLDLYIEEETLERITKNKE